jgi:hypothetical protein
MLICIRTRATMSQSYPMLVSDEGSIQITLLCLLTVSYIVCLMGGYPCTASLNLAQSLFFWFTKIISRNMFEEMAGNPGHPIALQILCRFVPS